MIKGLGWAGALRVVGKLLTFVKLIILARVLSPTAFGQFGAAVLALSFFETLTETGINHVLIYSDRKTEELLDSAWIVSIVRGVAISILIALSAYPLSWYFHDPMLVPLVLLIAVVPLVRGFVNPMVVTLVKELEFRREFLFRGAGAIVDLVVAVAVGVITRSSMAFAAALLLSAVTDLGLSFALFSVRPRLRFVRTYLAEIVGYGKWVTVSGIATWVASELDDFVVARLYGISALGTYQNGYKVATLPVTEISGTVNAVAFPVMSKVKADRDQLKRVFFGSAAATNILGIVLAAAIWFFPDMIVRTVLGPGWDDAIPIIRILALFGALRTLESSVQPLFLSTGRPQIASVGNALKVATLVVGLLVFANRGVTGVAFAALLSVLFVVPYYAANVMMVLRP